MDCHASTSALARNDGVWMVDCHAAAHAAARNDRNNAAFQSIASLEKVDSRSKAQPTQHDSKHYGVALHSIPKPKHHRRQDF